MLMFHGTSDIFHAGLADTGLAADPPERASAGGGEAALIAYSGVYFATSRETASFYAEKAASGFGGEPVIVSAEIDITLCLPDEDEVLFVLQGVLTELWEERDGEEGLAGLIRSDDHLRASLAVRAARRLKEAFEPESMDALTAEAVIDAMLLAGASAMEPDTADMVGDTGWLAQTWMVAAADGAQGLTDLRSRIDELCRCITGPRPTDSTCGEEAFKVRVPFDVGHSGPCRILSVDLLADPGPAPGM